MKAILSMTAGGPETLLLQETADPVAGPGQIIVRVKASGVNYPDTLIIEDRYQFKPPRPFAPEESQANIFFAAPIPILFSNCTPKTASVTFRCPCRSKNIFSKESFSRSTAIRFRHFRPNTNLRSLRFTAPNIFGSA